MPKDFLSGLVKLRLIYFDFKFIAFALFINEQSKNFNPFAFDDNAMGEQLRQIKIRYAAINQELNIDPDNQQFNVELETIIATTYQIRCRLYDQIQSFLNFERYSIDQDDVELTTFLSTFTDIKTALAKIDSQLDKIICTINLEGEPSNEQKEEFEQLINQAKNEITQLWQSFSDRSQAIKAKAQQLFLQSSLGELYTFAYQQGTRVVLLNGWLQELRKAAEKIQPTQRDSLHFALEIKKFLTGGKLQFYTRFYSADFHPHSAIDQYLFAALNSKIETKATSNQIIEQFMQKLRGDEAALRAEIHAQEQQLKNYSCTAGIVAGGLRPWLESYYFEFAKLFFDFTEELTAAGTFRDIPIMNVQLMEQYKISFTILASSLLLETDRRLYGKPVVIYALMNSFSQLLIANHLLNASQTIGLDEKTAVTSEPVLKWCLGLAIHLSLSALWYGFDGEMMGMLSACYIGGTAVKKLADIAITAAEKKLHGSQPRDRTQTLATNIFVKPWLLQFAYLGGHLLGGKLFGKLHHRFFKPALNPEELLSNPALCSRYADECKVAALEMLGLPENATSKQIHDIYRDLILQYHPDKAPSRDIPTDVAHEKTIAINTAKARLDELNT